MVTGVTASEHPGFETFSGTPSEVKPRLKGQGMVFVVTVPQGNSVPTDLISQSLSYWVTLFPTIADEKNQKVVEALFDSIVPKTPTAPHIIIEAKMQAEARRSLIESGDLVTATEIAKIADLSPKNPSQQPNKWKRERRIFAVRHRNADYFPSYALDADTDYRPLGALASILRTFEGRKDDWRTAFWFSSVNSFLGGRRPQDLLKSQPDRVLAAAQDEIADQIHG